MTLLDDAPRWIDLEGAVNARDLGGVPLADGGAIACGRLLRSDNLQDLTARDVDHLVADHGLRAVIDLRTGVEVRLEGPGPLIADERVVVEHRSLYPEAGEHTDVIEADTIVPWQNGVHGADLPGGDGDAALFSEARVAPVDRGAALRLKALWAVVGPWERLIGGEALARAARSAERR